MSDKKYNREDCIKLLQNKYRSLQAQNLSRYPQRSDFEEREVVAIKAFLGPWPRALEIAGIKPVRDVDRAQKNREKRIRAKQNRIERLRDKEKVKVKNRVEISEIISLALSEGFRSAEVIDTDKIVFDASFRPYCEANVCGQYGANYSCPPDCGSPEHMEQKVLNYKKALVVSTEWEIEDFSQADKLREVRLSHNAAMLRVIKVLKESGHEGIMIGASGCLLCNPCKRTTSEPCPHPDSAYSCMSAYCINVKRLAEGCNMNYEYKDKILPFFGMYVFN